MQLTTSENFKRVQQRSLPGARRVLACFVLLGGLRLFVLDAQSAGLLTTGNVEQIAPPASVTSGSLESSSFARVFAERTEFQLSQNILVDVTQPGFADHVIDLTPGQILANQIVDSYLLHADRITGGTPLVTFEGSVTFDRPILGAIVTTERLNATDSILGSPTTDYTPPAQFRGFDGPDFSVSAEAVRDSLQLSADYRTIDFLFRSATFCDQVRIITLAVPEPTLAAIVSFVVVGFGFLSRHKRAIGVD